MSNMETVAASAIRKVRWNVLPYLFFLYMIAYMDRTVVSIAALEMNPALGISATAFGWVAGIFYLGYIPFEIPSNIMLHRIGARKWLARILVTWGIAVVCTAYAQNLTQLLILRVITGAAEAGAFPGIVLYLTYWFPEKERARANSLFYMAIPITAIVNAPLGSFILDTVDWFGIEGWRWLFVIEGMPAVLLGLIVFFKLTDRPEQAKWLTQEEKDWLSSEMKKESAPKARSAHLTFSQIFSMPRVWLVAIIYLAAVNVQVGISMWLPSLIKSLGSTLGNTQIGLITMIPYIIGTIWMLTWSRHSDKTGERRFHVAIPSIMCGMGLLLCAFSENSIVKMAGLMFALASIYGFFAPYWTLPAQFLTEKGAAIGLALINTIASLGGFIGPFAIGYLRQSSGGLTAPVLFLCGGLAISIFLTLTMRKIDSPKESEAPPK